MFIDLGQVGLHFSLLFNIVHQQEFPLLLLFLLKEIGINARNWVDSAQNREYWRALVNAALNVRVP